MTTTTMPGASRLDARALLLCLAAVLGTMACLAAMPAKAAAATEWKGVFYSAPSNFVPGERAGIQVLPGNVGDTASTEYPTIKVELPAGLTFAESHPIWSCSGTSTLTCSLPFPIPIAASAYASFSLGIVVNVDPGATPGTYEIPITLEGGGATSPTSAVGEVTIADAPTGFGIVPSSFQAGAFDAAGNDFTEAGGHPDSAATSLRFNTKFNDPALSSEPFTAWNSLAVPNGTLKDTVVEAPPGLIGDPTVVPTCADTEKLSDDSCPAESQVGVIFFDQKSAMGNRASAIYNMARPKNQPALFGFRVPVGTTEVAGTAALTPMVRSDGDWGLSVKTLDVTEGSPLFAATVILWGKPADPAHNVLRCPRPNELTRSCAGVDSTGNPAFFGIPPDAYDPHASTAPLKPFLSLPTRCNGQPDATVMHASSWQDPAAFQPDGDPDVSDPGWVTLSAQAPPITGCEDLDFQPSLKARPTTNAADSPTGLEVNLHIPQNEDPDGLATAHLRKTAVTLPPGLVVNASGANGLAACSPQQIGLTSAVGNPDASFTRAPDSCPEAAKVATVEVHTPLLDHPMPGEVFVAAPHQNPFGSLLALYISIEDPQSSIVGKLAGEVRPNPLTGQLTAVFDDNPQVPFEDFKLNFFGGAAASLKTRRPAAPTPPPRS